MFCWHLERLHFSLTSINFFHLVKFDFCIFFDWVFFLEKKNHSKVLTRFFRWSRCFWLWTLLNPHLPHFINYFNLFLITISFSFLNLFNFSQFLEYFHPSKGYTFSVMRRNHIEIIFMYVISNSNQLLLKNFNLIVSEKLKVWSQISRIQLLKQLSIFHSTLLFVDGSPIFLFNSPSIDLRFFSSVALNLIKFLIEACL